ncbi:MAG: saccharopine dehydrogenase NADP-binding domain-containing protein, partial [Steroidobacteraceae bacterium]
PFCYGQVMREPIDFAGRVVMIGCGSIGQVVLPLLRNHLALGSDALQVLSADERGRGIAQACGARFVHCHLKPGNFHRQLSRYLAAGDLMLNLSVDVSSLDLVEWCAEHGVLYVDTSIEPWPGVFNNPMLTLRERTNFITRERMLRLGRKLGADSTTAVVDHGANPGLVSHFVKQALLDLRDALLPEREDPGERQAWAALCRDLGVQLIQVSERDTQAAERPKRPGEFVNTWSIDGFVDELMQPSELSLGTVEPGRPGGAYWHRDGCGSVYLRRPGGGTYGRSWLPSLGGFQGLLMTHDEVFSIADYFSQRSTRGFEYRPTVMFVYHPCDDAMLSALELEGRGWVMQPSQRVLAKDIVTGMDELGVLLAGHDRNAYWYGSQLTIEEARRHVPHANATSLQVAAGALAAAVWAVQHPTCGVREADELDFRECLAVARPYLGPVVGAYTDWTPLQGRGELFEEDLDADRPWQLKNVRARQWRA